METGDAVNQSRDMAMMDSDLDDGDSEIPEGRRGRIFELECARPGDCGRSFFRVERNGGGTGEVVVRSDRSLDSAFASTPNCANQR